MPENNITNSEIVVTLQQLVKEFGSQRAAAKALGNGNFQSSISNSLSGVRMPSKGLRVALDDHYAREAVDQDTTTRRSQLLPESLIELVEMRLTKSTPGTYRYDATGEGAAVKNLYLQKVTVIDEVPQVIEVAVLVGGSE